MKLGKTAKERKNVGEAKRRKKLDPNYGKVTNLTKRQKAELERKKHEYLQEGNAYAAGEIMYELGDKILDEESNPIEFKDKAAFAEHWVKKWEESKKGNTKFVEMMERFEKKYGGAKTKEETMRRMEKFLKEEKERRNQTTQ